MERIVLVTKSTRLDDLVRVHMTENAAEFALETHDQSIAPYRRENAAYQAALDAIRHAIPNDLSLAVVERASLPHFLFRETDLIVICGPDGLFVNTAKYLSGQPVLTVNPDPETVAGVLMLFQPSEVKEVLGRIIKGTHKTERLPLLKATVDGEQTLWSANDVFIGRKDHMSARYEISFSGKSEKHSSSGIIVATGVGSTGWLRSITAMVEGLAGPKHRLTAPPEAANQELIFVVREPFPSPATGTSIITGRVIPRRSLTVVSEMPSGGFIFSDGILEAAIPWNAGSTVEVTVGERYVERIVR